MEINISKTVWKYLTVFLLVILPLLIILLGAVFNILIAWYYILSATWFCMGVIFYGATN